MAAAPDTDGDGLSDELEQRLLDQFAPSFLIGRQDCSNTPAEFQPEMKVPTVKQEDGTIYGQASPYRQALPAKAAGRGAGRETRTVELHFYHLWRVDCGPHGHHLDTEHVAALVEASGDDPLTARWHAIYWYAAAHENTVCDVSQIARAATLKAEDHGARVWISPGKHASYLNGELCRRGCGADRCEQMKPLSVAKIVNLGEPGHVMNGSVFVASSQWPLLAKMQATNFPAEPVARLSALPQDEIGWFSPGRHPAQQVIAISGATESHLANSADNTGGAIANATDATGGAISVAGDATGNALSSAGDATGNGLDKSYHKTAHALGSSAKHVGRALHLTPKAKAADVPE